MKKIFNLLILLIFIISVSSCDNQDQDLLTASAKGSGEITAPQPGTTYVLNQEETQTNIIFTLTWNKADFGVLTVVNYNIEFAKSGTEFATPVLAGTTTNTFLTWTIKEFNQSVINSGLIPLTEASIDVRVIATIGSVNSTPQTSEVVSVFVTPYPTDLPKIAVLLDYQAWDPTIAPLLASSEFGETDYEGYVWLDGDYKFLGPNEFLEFVNGNTDWGDNGSFTGILLETDEVNCNEPVAGYYFVNADTDALTYNAINTEWGLIGSATPNNWDSDQNMTYDSEAKIWSITIDLTAEEMKFRANDEWTINFGDNDADSSLEQDGANIAIPTAGNYTVVLDLSNPREYTYSLTLN